jgi:hypothetical protein
VGVWVCVWVCGCVRVCVCACVRAGTWRKRERKELAAGDSDCEDLGKMGSQVPSMCLRTYMHEPMLIQYGLMHVCP